MQIKAGAILVLEHGEYSDYAFDGPFRVLKDFDQAKIATTFCEQWTSLDEWKTKPDESDFIAWMNTNGYIEDIETHRWHIGSYGFDPQIQNEPS